MQHRAKPTPERDSEQAGVHISNAHEILKALEEKIGKHPEIGVVIRDSAEYFGGKD